MGFRKNINTVGYDRYKKASISEQVENLLEIKGQIISLDTAIDDIKQFNLSDKSNLNRVSQIKDDIAKVANTDTYIKLLTKDNNLEAVKDVFGKLDMMKTLLVDYDEMKKFKADSCMIHTRNKQVLDRVKDYSSSMVDLYGSSMVPLVVDIKQQLKLATQLVDTKIQQIIDANSEAYKFMTYKHIIKPCPMSYEEGPFVKIVDPQGNEPGKVIYNIPKPMCVQKIDDIPITAVQSAVNAYLATFPNMGGEVDEPITVDDLPNEEQEIEIINDTTIVTADDWEFFGSPLGYVDSGYLVPNGDSNYESGVYLKTLLNLSKSYRLEYTIIQPLHGNNPHTYIRAGFDTVHFTGTTGIASLDIANLFVDGGQANNGHTTHAICYEARGGIDAQCTLQNDGALHTYKIEYRPNIQQNSYEVKYYYEGNLYATVSKTLPNDLTVPMRFGISGRGNDSKLGSIKIEEQIND